MMAAICTVIGLTTNYNGDSFPRWKNNRPVALCRPAGAPVRIVGSYPQLALWAINIPLASPTRRPSTLTSAIRIARYIAARSNNSSGCVKSEVGLVKDDSLEIEISP